MCRARCADVRLSAAVGPASHCALQKTSVYHIFVACTDVKVFPVGRLVKKMTKFVYIDIYWLSLSLDPHRTRQKPHFPNRPEYSLMTRSNSLLSREKFPVPARRELPSTALKLLSYSAHLLGPRPIQRAKFPVFSQLAGNLPEPWPTVWGMV